MARRRQKGTGEVFQEGAGWAIRWRENGRRRYRGCFLTPDDARRVLDKVRGEIAQGRAGMPPDMRGTPTLAELSKDWLDAREHDGAHRSIKDDRLRWEKHLKPHFGHLRPAEVDVARIRSFAEAKLREGLSSTTVRLCVTLLSAFFQRLRAEPRKTGASVNPCRDLPREVAALLRRAHDPKTTPFVERLEDVRSIVLALEDPVRVAYALGAMAGLRTGEIVALRWEHVDLKARRIHVRESMKGPLKDKDSRVVPILTPLLPVLEAWKLQKRGKGLVVPPMRSDGDMVDARALGRHLAAALGDLKLAREGLGWYEATRHTFASQWVMAGGSIEKLKEILGHCSVVVTERYAHLRPDLFAERDLGTLAVDLRPGAAEPIAIGQKSARPQIVNTRQAAES